MKLGLIEVAAFLSELELRDSQAYRVFSEDLSEGMRGEVMRLELKEGERLTLTEPHRRGGGGEVLLQ